jgi:hypothetical protein
VLIIGRLQPGGYSQAVPWLRQFPPRRTGFAFSAVLVGLNYTGTGFSPGTSVFSSQFYTTVIRRVDNGSAGGLISISTTTVLGCHKNDRRLLQSTPQVELVCAFFVWSAQEVKFGRQLWVVSL